MGLLVAQTWVRPSSSSHVMFPCEIRGLGYKTQNQFVFIPDPISCILSYPVSYPILYPILSCILSYLLSCNLSCILSCISYVFYATRVIFTKRAASKHKKRMKRTLLVALKRTKTNSEGILLVGKRKNNDEGFSLLVALQKTKQEGREGISLLVAFKKERKRRGKYFLVTVKRKKTTRGGNPSLSHRKILKKMTEENENACLCGRPSLSFQE